MLSARLPADQVFVEAQALWETEEADERQKEADRRKEELVEKEEEEEEEEDEEVKPSWKCKIRDGKGEEEEGEKKEEEKEEEARRLLFHHLSLVIGFYQKEIFPKKT
jgi:hypothetical protein